MGRGGEGNFWMCTAVSVKVSRHREKNVLPRVHEARILREDGRAIIDQQSCMFTKLEEVGVCGRDSRGPSVGTCGEASEVERDGARVSTVHPHLRPHQSLRR